MAPLRRLSAALKLSEQYELLADTPSDIVEHLPYFFELATDATTVIELGVRSGTSTVAWLAGLEGHGHLWSVDIEPAPPITANDWTFLQGDDCAIADRLPDLVDVVFIDTSHHYQHTLCELATFVPKVRPGGVVLLHDTELEIPEGAPADDPRFPVKTAVSEFCAAHGLGWVNRPNCYGLGIISIGEEP